MIKILTPNDTSSNEFLSYFYNLEAMRYFDRSDDSKLSPTLLQKKYDMINNKNNEYIASQKWDGNWMMFIKDTEGQIYIRGRNRNTKNEYENYAPKIPHLAELFNDLVRNGTVFLVEVCWAKLGKIATDVGTILRCLPEKAVKRQEQEKLVGKIFDVLAINGEMLLDQGYELRINCLRDYEPELTSYLQLTTFFEDNFAERADEIIAAGGEGIVIERKDYIYEPGKRTAWKTLKLKQTLPCLELPVIDTLAPTREYNGITELELWPYWEGYYKDDPEDRIKIEHAPGNIDKEYNLVWAPVTKPYWYGWKAGVVVNFNGNEVKVTSGTTDDDKQWLSTAEAQEYINAGKLIAVVKGMQETTNANGGSSIRHPILVTLRIDA